ncbi:MAG: NnrS family protein [Pseudomonadota bacterium]|nr:NnrS family protein [Pseudomonadota bacterium]
MKALPVLSIGFRPFFLLAALYAVLSIVLWVLTYTGAHALPTLWNPVLWHGHEMIFGFTMAVVAGFLLTASANWTGQPPVRSWTLLGLVVLWMAGRAAMLSDFLPAHYAAIIEGAFLPAVILSLAPMLIRAEQLRNMAFLVILTLFTLLNIGIHLSVLGVIETSASNLLYLAVHVVIFLIAVIGGRVLPFFTRNGLTQRGHDIEIKAFPYINEISLSILLVTCLYGYISAFSGVVFGILALCTSALHLARLTQWKSHKTLSVPIIWILHFGYFWLVLGFFLEGLYALGVLVSFQAVLHTFTIGAIGTMILGMMTRVCLGHTGRPIVSLKSMVIAYVLLQGAALSRLIGETVLVNYYTESVQVSGYLWAASFGLFAIRYARMLLTKRPDGKSA